MNRSRSLMVFLLIALVAADIRAQQADPSLLTLERIFSSREFAPERFGPARWVDGGAGYTTLEPSSNAKGGTDIVRYETQTGKRSALVAADRLIPKGKASPLPIDDYRWSQDGRRLLVYTNSKRVWRQNTRGDYWVLNLSNGKLVKLGGDAAESTLMFAEFSPDGNRVAYVRENNIYVENIDGNRITKLTADGSRRIINGTFDWVYEEEFGLRKGWRWSPDGKSIAYWQLDTDGVKDFYLINNTDSLYPTLTPIQYPKAGHTNSAIRVGVINADGGATRWFEIAGDSRNYYIAGMDWAGNSHEVLLFHLNRKQNLLQLMLGDARTGKTRTILTERDDAWVDLRASDMQWLDAGNRFTWVTERDGWRHVYIEGRNGKTDRLVTAGDFDVINVQGVDEKGGWLYFTASPDNPTQQYLYRTKLDGKGKPERLSPMTQTGNHSYDISPDFTWAFHTHSSFNTPPRSSLIRLPQHIEVRPLAENAALRGRVKNLKRGPMEFFRVNIGEGIELDGWIIKPPDFDPSKRYPLFFYVYGEPASQTVVDRWGGSRYLWHLMLAQQGYLVASVDNRGTPAPKGRGWRKVIYRKVGLLASIEQAAAAQQMMKWPFVDPERIGIWGWSGGGSMTLNAMFRYPEIYRVGMSVAPVSDMHYYDTIYQERYMGLPQDNEEDYKQGSPITFAERLKGDLLIVHGTGDDNVHYQNAEALINKLIAANKPFSMMSYPNRSHGISEGRNTSRHLFELLTRYLREHLPAGPSAGVRGRGSGNGGNSGGRNAGTRRNGAKVKGQKSESLRSCADLRL